MCLRGIERKEKNRNVNAICSATLWNARCSVFSLTEIVGEFWKIPFRAFVSPMDIRDSFFVAMKHLLQAIEEFSLLPSGHMCHLKTIQLTMASNKRQER